MRSLQLDLCPTAVAETERSAKRWTFAGSERGLGSLVLVRVRVQLIRHLKTCTTDIFLHHECAHGRLSVHAPVDL